MTAGGIRTTVVWLEPTSSHSPEEILIANDAGHMIIQFRTQQCFCFQLVLCGWNIHAYLLCVTQRASVNFQTIMMGTLQCFVHKKKAEHQPAERLQAYMKMPLNTDMLFLQEQRGGWKVKSKGGSVVNALLGSQMSVIWLWQETAFSQQYLKKPACNLLHLDEQINTDH